MFGDARLLNKKTLHFLFVRCNALQITPNVVVKGLVGKITDSVHVKINTKITL